MIRVNAFEIVEKQVDISRGYGLDLLRYTISSRRNGTNWDIENNHPLSARLFTFLFFISTRKL